MARQMFPLYIRRYDANHASATVPIEMKQPSYLRPMVTACALVLSAGAAVAADDASPWDGDARSAARLIAGSQPQGTAVAPLRAGIEIRLKPGWHTYWRYPGDAGVPPQIAFDGSQNVKTVEPLWPAARRFVEGGLAVIGYDDGVILPLRITPQDIGHPVVLQLAIDYAICEKLCVPARAKAALALHQGLSSEDAALVAAEARVPKRLAVGEGGALAIRSVRREDDGPRPRLVVDVAAPGPVDLFAEGPTPQWSLPLPAPVAGAPAGLQRFAFELDGAPPGADYAGALITLTGVTEDAAIEVPFRLH